MTEVVIPTVWDMAAQVLSDPTFWAVFIVATGLISYYVRCRRFRQMGVR